VVGVGTMLAVFVSALIGRSVRRAATVRALLAGGFAAGALAQLCRVVIKWAQVEWFYAPYRHPLSLAWISVPANGFGVLLLVLVVTEAQARAESERRRVDMERAHALAVEAQLAALRARIHPHFLFNTLTSIVALCDISPSRAKAALRRLGQLMSQALQAGASAAIDLTEELETVRAYLEIEQERFGPRLRVDLNADEAVASVKVPPFAIQTLAENAINHGVAASPRGGAVSISVRSDARRVLVAIRDNGQGMSVETLSRARGVESEEAKNGLRIVRQQLLVMYGRRARLRLFSRPGMGTLAVVVLPVASSPAASRARQPEGALRA